MHPIYCLSLSFPPVPSELTDFHETWYVCVYTYIYHVTTVHVISSQTTCTLFRHLDDHAS